jgi:GTPase
MTAFKSGFVNILGNPNVGKSTLMNAMVGEKLSIITPKAQTTRHRIMGIVNGDNYQIVFSDTPGILKPNYKLQEAMLSFVNTAFSDADIILYVTDVVEAPDKHLPYIEKLKKTEVPLYVLINKIDLTNEQELTVLTERWHEILPDAQILPISAKHKFQIDLLFQVIVKKLPEGPPYFPDDMLTDKPMRFFVAEIIREKIFFHYRKEIPYSVEVEVDAYKEEDRIVRISALIYVVRKTHKSILIGKGGVSLKKIGTEARLELESFIGKKVFLELFVKVKEDWKNNDNNLKSFGYF